MSQIYIAQSSQANAPTPVANQPPFYANPAFVLSVISMLAAAVIGMMLRRVNNKLTFIDNYRKELNAKEVELDNRQVKIMVDEENLDLKKSIHNTNEKVSEISNTLKEISQVLGTLATKEETQEGFSQVNERFDKLIKGTPDEGKI